MLFAVLWHMPHYLLPASSTSRLDQELDFILSQQKELEDLLNPLEESVKEQSGTIYLQHADEEREKT